MTKFKLYDTVCLIAPHEQGGVLFPADVPMTIVDIHDKPEGYTLDCEELQDCVTVPPEAIMLPQA